MKNKLPIILFIATMVFGTIGYVVEEMPAYEAFISSFALATLNAGLEPTNVFIEIARWTGILFALDIVFTLLASAVEASTEEIRIRKRVKEPGATAVHGDGLFADRLAQSLGDKAIRSDRHASFAAPCQVLLFSTDETAIKFFNDHADDLAQANEVYLGLDRMTPDVSQHANVFTFNMAEVCAQLYRADHPVTTPETIALIGDGAYAEALLTQALLVNIFDVKGGITYRLYGDFSQYRHLHTQLDAAQAVNADTIVFCDQPWHADLAHLATCDRIILCGSTDFDLETASKLQSANIDAPLHIRCDNAANLDLVNRDNALAFGTSEQLCTGAIVIQQRQHDGGKICDIAYRMGTPDCDGCTRQKGFPQENILGTEAAQREAIKEQRMAAADYEVCLTCPMFQKAWRAMDLFTKGSNYAVAAHDQQKMRLMEEAGASRDAENGFASLPLEERDRLQEIEHIRWCRYHYLNNWTYGPDGKDKAARTHHYLVPYDQLTRQIKDYDGDSYQTLWLRYHV